MKLFKLIKKKNNGNGFCALLVHSLPSLMNTILREETKKSSAPKKKMTVCAELFACQEQENMNLKSFQDQVLNIPSTDLLL